MKKLIIIINLILFTGLSFGQDNTSGAIDELNTIYTNLEYNTIAFNDLKNKWFINDPGFIREIYNRFAVKNAFRNIDGTEASVETIMEKSEQVFEGNVVIDLRKRFYDDEIEYFAFVSADEIEKVNPRPLFEPVTDGFYLRDIIGNKLYNKIQEKNYFFAGYTKDVFTTKSGYFFDIYLNLLEPEIMFWSTTSNKRNKYLVSVAGKWGLDEVFIPGWYSSHYFVGGKMTYYNALGADPDNYTYSIFLGHSFRTGKPYSSTLADEVTKTTGDAIYAKVSGDVGKFLFSDFDKLYLSAEGMGTYTDYGKKEFDDVPLNDPFYSIKNFFAATLTKKELFNLFDFGQFEAGLGVGTHDVTEYELIPSTSKLVETNPKDFFAKFQHYAMAHVGVENKGDLIQHHIKIRGGYNVVAEYAFVGIDTQVMLSNTFGFDVKFYSGIDVSTSRSPWRTDSYMVFSPIIRINY